MKKLTVATVFSGIGSAEYALKQLGVEHELLFACDNGERYIKKTREEIEEELSGLTDNEKQKKVKEIYDRLKNENRVKKSYFANYDIEEDQWYEDVRFINGKKYRDKVDLFVGGSPCQSFSTYGLKRGLEDVRGTLFYDYARLVDEIRPKVFIYENVKGLLVHDSGKTWKIMQELFDTLNYDIYYQVLDAKNYGMPQMRKRIFVVGFNRDYKYKTFEFPQPVELTTKVVDYLDKEVDDIYYLPEKGFKWVTDVSRNQNKSRINRDVMGCQTAVQQYNWSGDFRIEDPKPSHEADDNIYIGEYEGERKVARKLTPTECLRLMGYDHFKIVNDDKTMYRQSGNSIVVPVMKALISQILVSLEV